MKILFIINSLLEKAGSERVACQVANLFHTELGHNVTLLNRFATRDKCAFEINNEVNYILVTGNYLCFYKKLQEIIQRNQYDIIIIHNMGKMSLLCSLLDKNRAKLVSLEHVAFSSRPLWIQHVSKILYKKINTIVTLTDRDNKEYSDWHHEVVKINNISPFQTCKNNNLSTKKIIAVGRLTYQKNFQSLLMAWEKVAHRLPDWTLEIYGKGEDEQALREYINIHGMKNVHLKGVYSNMQEVYEQSSLLVMSSRYEGLPMVLIEAQSFGLPIISFDCPYGPREIIEHKKTGLLVEEGNINNLSKAILELTTNPKILAEYSINARQAAKRYHQDAILNDWNEKILRVEGLLV